MNVANRPHVICGCPVVLTCMFVVRMCFLALVTAPLLQEKSSTLHHEEALTQAARHATEQLEAATHRHETLDTTLQRKRSVQFFQFVYC